MRIKSVAYLGSFGRADLFPSERGPEVVFLGRSNVGKSTLINTLLGRRNIARTSNTPGKTRTANYYLVNDKFCFVDMPGYGYAQVSKAERARWGKLIERYLKERSELCGAVHLLDTRHTPSDGDRKASAVIKESGRRLCIVFNKVDKVKRDGVDKKIAGHLGHLPVDTAAAVVPFSSETGEGRRELWAWIQESLDLPSRR